MKLLLLLSYIIVPWAHLLTLVFFLLSLHSNSVLVGLEADLVEKWSDALRFEGSRGSLSLLLFQAVVLARTYVAHWPHFELPPSFFGETWPDGAFELVSVHFLIFFYGRSGHFYILFDLKFSHIWDSWGSSGLFLDVLPNSIAGVASRFIVVLFYLFFSLFGWICVDVRVHCPGPTDGSMLFLKRSSSLWKDAVPRYPNLTITLLFFLRMVCTIGRMMGRLTS